MRRFSLLLPMLAVLALAACEDPSSVGDTFIDDVAPRRVVLPLPDADTLRVVDRTGQAGPVLVGAVYDPLLDVTFRAQGFVDFQGPLINNLLDIAGVDLLLAPTYTYGDTTATLTLVVRDMPDEWTSTNARADTTFAVGEELARVTFSPGDTLVSVPLPERWYAARDTSLLKALDQFNKDIHGFSLRVEGTGAVVGFSEIGSLLRLRSETDTLRLDVGKIHTTLDQSGTVRQFDGRLTLVDGFGPFGEMEFVLPDSLKRAVANKISLRVTADTTLLQSNRPTHFVRPLLGRLLLYGVQANGSEVLLQDLLNPQSTAGFLQNGTYTFNDLILTARLQGVLLGNASITGFRLRVAQSPNSISPIILYDETAGDKAPRLVFTLLPADR